MLERATQVAVEPDDRSPIALAVGWSYRIMTVSLEMVVPGMLGYVVDGWLGTGVLLAVLGFAGGMTLAIWHLIRMTSRPPGQQPQASADAEGNRKS